MPTIDEVKNQMLVPLQYCEAKRTYCRFCTPKRICLIRFAECEYSRGEGRQYKERREKINEK